MYLNNYCVFVTLAKNKRMLQTHSILYSSIHTLQVQLNKNKIL